MSHKVIAELAAYLYCACAAMIPCLKGSSLHASGPVHPRSPQIQAFGAPEAYLLNSQTKVLNILQFHLGCQ
jgi:hypothetical protein